VETALAIIVAVVAVAGGIAVAVLAGRLASARGDARDAARAMDAAVQANKAQEDHKVRLELVITSLKAEITALEKDLDACHDPSVVRDRLRRMLAPAGGDSSGGVVS
jgi:hypothetical protein